MEPSEQEIPVNWAGARESALYTARYNLKMARERGGLCAEFAGLVVAAMGKEFGDNGVRLPALTAEEIGVLSGELEEIIEVGRAMQARALAALTDQRNRPQEGAQAKVP